MISYLFSINSFLLPLLVLAFCEFCTICIFTCFIPEFSLNKNITKEKRKPISDMKLNSKLYMFCYYDPPLYSHSAVTYISLVFVYYSKTTSDLETSNGTI